MLFRDAFRRAVDREKFWWAHADKVLIVSLAIAIAVVVLAESLWR